jgi:hypothetical protein
MPLSVAKLDFVTLGNGTYKLSHVSIGKVCVITPATATQNSTCLGYLGQHDTDRIVSISCCAAQGGQGKYCRASQGDNQVLLSPTVSLTNVANVNDPLTNLWCVVQGDQGMPLTSIFASVSVFISMVNIVTQD